MENKPVIMISFKSGAENGGPYISHKRIMESQLKKKYDFYPLMFPQKRLGIINVKVILGLVKQIKKTNPDIVHFTGLQLEGFYITIACIFAGAKNTVLAIHGSSNEAIEFAWYKRVILNVLEAFTIKNAALCYGVSNYVTCWNTVKKNARNNTECIYNLPHEQYVKKCNELSIRSELTIFPDDVVVVSTGRITREKGYEVLCEVIKQIGIVDHLKYIIAGTGEYLDTMRKEIELAGLSEIVFFLGYRSDIGKILSESNIFVIATLHETLCNSIIEAGMEGLPVVASNVGGIPEIIEDGYNGYLIDAYDSDSIARTLRKLISDPDLVRQMGSNAKLLASQKFSATKITKQIDNLYEVILKNRKKEFWS